MPLKVNYYKAPNMKKYKINNIELEFNDSNLIPVYQEQHRLYDRFLPHMATYLEGTIIDVGANCGALAVAMGSNNPALEFICIEPEQTHIEHFENNVKKISNVVRLDKAKIGKFFKPLDKVIEEFEVGKIGLLKVDVDGYDWDVIDTFSFGQKPPIYIEEDTKELWHYEKYHEMNNKLSSLGYNNIWMFDNYGCLIGFTKDWEMVHTLNAYVHRMKAGKSNMSFWYMDLLVCQDEDINKLSPGVMTYLNA